jgi:hypothetical protein
LVTSSSRSARQAAASPRRTRSGSSTASSSRTTSSSPRAAACAWPTSGSPSRSGTRRHLSPGRLPSWRRSRCGPTRSTLVRTSSRSRPSAFPAFRPFRGRGRSRARHRRTRSSHVLPPRIGGAARRRLLRRRGPRVVEWVAPLRAQAARLGAPPRRRRARGRAHVLSLSRGDRPIREHARRRRGGPRGRPGRDGDARPSTLGGDRHPTKDRCLQGAGAAARTDGTARSSQRVRCTRGRGARAGS